MNGTKRRFRRNASIAAAALVFLALAFLAGALRADAKEAACLAYAAAASVFLVAQIAGFVLTQVKYSDAVERAKFDVLRKEEEEWR